MSQLNFWEKGNRPGALSDNDPNSFSNPESIQHVSMHIKWHVDFETKILKGSVQYNLRRSVDSKATSVIFDTLGLSFKSVRLVKDESDLGYKVGAFVDTFGSPLEINLPNTDWTELSIVIDYETTPKCTALQWLAKEQTAGKQHPYLFTKCSAIQARSIIPCQDTPSVKISYTAEVTAPSELTVLMGAVRQGDTVDIGSNFRQHHFVQNVAIPCYLIAMVIGKLESKRIGPRSCVWAEKEVLDAAAYEFEDTEKILAAEEQFLGEYVWGTYDLLVMPPSYPAGGMENPCLTFIAPSVIAGDKSLVNVVAHEIAHSWSGNLVTNKTFEHFWLNEGITVYLERRVLGNIHGEPFRQFLAIGGLKQLKESIRAMGTDNPMTSLVPNLAGVNPMNSFSVVPYEKGFLFLYYLEHVVGGKSTFERFLKKYIWENTYTSVDTTKFRSMFIDFFVENGKSAEIEKIDWGSWLFGMGLPNFEPQYDRTLADVSTELKTRWMTWDADSTPSCPFSSSDLDAFTLGSHQLWEFLAQLNEDTGSLGLKKIEALGQAYNLSATGNTEIKFLWIMICLKGKYAKIVPLAIALITEQGRMKFVRPIYKALYDWTETRPLAIETFQKNRSSMMSNSATIISKDLNLADQK